MAEKLILDNEIARELAEEDHDRSIYAVIKNQIVDTRRWSITYELIIQTLSDGKFWKSNYSQGATEQQDESPFEYGIAEFVEVFPKQIEVTVYESVD